MNLGAPREQPLRLFFLYRRRRRLIVAEQRHALSCNAFDLNLASATAFSLLPTYSGSCLNGSGAYAHGWFRFGDIN